MSGLLALLFFEPDWDVKHFVGYGMAALSHRGEVGKLCYVSGESVKCEEISEDDKTVPVEGSVAVGAWVSKGFQEKQAVEGESLAVLFDRPCRYASDVVESLQKISSSSYPYIDLPRLLSQFGGHDIPSFVALTSKGEVVAWRTSSGLTHLAVGGYGFDMVVVSSESSVTEVLDADVRKHLAPGEGLYASRRLVKTFKLSVPDKCLTCLFELLYLLRHDSYVNGVSVYEFRKTLGGELGKHLKNPVDVVVGIPETAIPYAVGLSQATGARYELGFVTTVKRVRSMLKKSLREKMIAIHLKLNPIRAALEGKSVAVVDDSMVTGSTLKTVSQILRHRIGVSEIHMFIASPRILNSCPYGVVNFDDSSLIAANLDSSSIEKFLEVDSISWLRNGDVHKVSKKFGMRFCGLCLGAESIGGDL